MPDGRSELYAIWKACERFKILPPEITHNSWDKMNLHERASIIAYDHIRTIETNKYEVELAKAGVASRLM